MASEQFRRFLYRTYRSSVGFEPWGIWRFTRAGILVLIMLVASAVIGLDTRATVVYRGFALLFMLLLIAFLWSLVFQIRLTLNRTLPRFGTVGESLEYRIAVRNDTSHPQQGLFLIDNVADSLPTEDEFVSTPEPGEERRNLYDRTLLVYRWYWLIARKQGVKIKEQPIPRLGPHEEADVTITVTPSRRGYIRLGDVRIIRPDPFNLYKAFVRIPLPQSLLILPKRYSLPPIQLPGKRKFKLGGVALASSVGDSEEFMSLRDYRPGDPLRHIHWKSWAKTGKPIVKEFQAEYFVRHALVLDTFQQAGYSEVFEEAVSLAASFACTITTQESLLDLMFIGPEAYCFTVGRGLGYTEQMLEILAEVKPCHDKAFSVLPPVVLERASLLSGCICILLAWDEERQQFVRGLQALNIPLTVFVITDAHAAQSLDPGPMQTIPEHFYHLETGKIEEGLKRIAV